MSPSPTLISANDEKTKQMSQRLCVAAESRETVQSVNEACPQQSKYKPRISINELKHTHRKMTMNKNDSLNKTETLMNEFKSVYFSLSF